MKRFFEKFNTAVSVITIVASLLTGTGGVVGNKLLGEPTVTDPASFWASPLIGSLLIGLLQQLSTVLIDWLRNKFAAQEGV